MSADRFEGRDAGVTLSPPSERLPPECDSGTGPPLPLAGRARLGDALLDASSASTRSDSVRVGGAGFFLLLWLRLAGRTTETTRFGVRTGEVLSTTFSLPFDEYVRAAFFGTRGSSSSSSASSSSVSSIGGGGGFALALVVD